MCVLFLRWFLKNLLYEEEEDEDFFLFYPGAFIILYIYMRSTYELLERERERESSRLLSCRLRVCVVCVCVKDRLIFLKKKVK